MRAVMRSSARVLATLIVLGSGLVGEAYAETAWVRGEVRLNIRTGPGTQYRILGLVTTGDEVQVLDRTEEWTKIQSKDEEGNVKQGWIPEGYLRPDPPPTVRLTTAETRVETLEGQLATLTEETEKLRADNQILTSQDGEQQSEIQRLTMDNMELRAGARYPEWITGASIFAAGMVLGAWLRWNSTRRQTSRIRL